MEIRPATWDDIDAVFDLLAARGRALYGISDWTLQHLRVEWELPSFDVGRDNWVAVEDERVLGYAAVSATKDLVHIASDSSVGDALLANAVGRARERGFDVIRVIAAPADRPLRGLVERHGFELETEILRMWKRLDEAEPAARWPAGISARTYEPTDAEAVQGLLDEAYLAWDGGYVPMAQDDWVEWMTRDTDFDPSVWWLAESGGELVGCALHWRSGWLKDLAVRESHRGRGLGKSLLLEGFSEFARRGVPRVGLKVDAGNPTGAVQLYERLGFVTDRREEIRALWL